MLKGNGLHIKKRQEGERELGDGFSLFSGDAVVEERVELMRATEEENETGRESFWPL